MSLGSANDSGRRPWSLGFWFGTASLVPGVLLAILSLWATAGILGYLRPHGSGGDPQGSMGGGGGDIVLIAIVVAVALFGSVLALIGLIRPPRRWAVVGLGLNLGCPLLFTCFCIAFIFYSMRWPPPPPAPAPKIPPTAFFEWCEDNNFGVKSRVVWKTSDYISETRGARLVARTPCKTEDEARNFVEAAVVELQRMAKEKGISLKEESHFQKAKDVPWDTQSQDGQRISLVYLSGSNRGTLFVEYEPTYTTEDGEPGKKYEIWFWLIEA
jgi:hypothetical protein